jgi:hypothetical protein
MADDKTPYERAMGQFMGDEEPVTYDLGFMPQEIEDPINKLGQAAINMEEVQQKIQDQIEKHLGIAQANVAMMQSRISSQLYDQMVRAKDSVRTVHQPIETQIAMQMGKAFEVANQVAPYDSVVRAVAGNEQEEQWKQAAQKTQQLIAQPQTIIGQQPPPGSGVGGSGPLPGGPGAPPTQSLPGFGSCMTQAQADAYLCANYDSLIANAPIYSGGQATIPILCFDTPNGRHSIYYVWPANITTGQPIKGSKAGLQSSSPFGLYATTRPANCSPITPPPPNPPPPPDIPIDPQCPPQIPCPPVKECPPCPPPKEPPCIKICREEPEDCKETEYDLYCTEGGIAYMVEKDQDPHSKNDKRLSTGKGSGLDLSQIAKECSKKRDEPPAPTSSPSPLIFAPFEGCDGLVSGFGMTVPADGKFLESLLDFDPSSTTLGADSGDAIVDGLSKWLVENLTRPAFKGVDHLILGLVKWFNQSGCNSPQAYSAVVAKAIAGLLSRVFGRQTDPIETVAEYAYNSNCPYRLPTSEEATRAYLTNSIDLSRLICLVQANGHRWDTWGQIVNSARSRLNVQETLVGWKRGIIPTEWADENLRQLGYLEGPETEILKQLTDQIPPMSDLITMMMRDVADEANIDWSEIDKLFGEKWTGQLKQWGKEQGVPDLYAKYAWRAHFVIPSPTQLFEFWRRLRYKGVLGTKDQTLEKIKGALIQQDIAPQWIDAFLEVAHQPLTRVDTRRAYEIGAIGEQDVYDSYIDQGYSDQNAARLTQFAKAQQIERAKRSPLIRRYAAGELTFDDLTLELSESGFSNEMIDTATAKAQRELRYRRRKTCLAAMKKRYLLGEYKFPEIRDKIQSEGIDPLQSEEIAKGWECEKQRRGKAVPAQTLCEWYTLGVITDVDMYSRLLNLGYDQDDAAKLTQSCRIRLGLKLQKDQQKAIADTIRRAKQDAASARAAGQHLEKELGKVVRANEKRRSTKARRQKLLLEAAQTFANRNLFPYADAAIGLQAAIDAAIAGGLADTDTVYQTATIAAKSEECDSLNCFSRLLGELLTVEAAVPSI